MLKLDICLKLFFMITLISLQHVSNVNVQEFKWSYQYRQINTLLVESHISELCI